MVGYINFFFVVKNGFLINCLLYGNKSLLLQLNGWLLMNRKVYLMDIRFSPSSNHILPKGASCPVSNT